MPTFEFTSPEGKKYVVEGPEGSTQEQAFSQLQQQLQQAPTPPSSPSPTNLSYAQAGGPAAMAPTGPQGPTMGESLERGLLDLGQGGKHTMYWALEKAGMLPQGTAERYAKSVTEGQDAYAEKRRGITSPDYLRTLANVGPLFAFPQGRLARGLESLAGRAGIGPGAARVMGEIGAGEAGGALAAGTTLPDQSDKKGAQLITGTVLGGALPGLGMLGRKAFGNTQTESQRLMAEQARSATPPIPLTPKEEYGSPITPRLEAALNMTLGGSAAFKAFEQRQQQALTANVAAQLRQRTNEFTPEIRQNIERQIDGLYNQALQGKAIMPDAQLRQDFAAILREQARKPEADQDNFVISYIMGKGGNLQKPQLDPAWARPMSASLYNQQRSMLGKRSVKMYRSDNTFDAQATSALQDALDSWAQRRVGPDRVAALQEARRMSRVWYTTQDALDESSGKIDAARFVKTLERDEARDATLEPLRNLVSTAYNIRQRPFSPIGIGLGSIGLTSLLSGAPSGFNDSGSMVTGAVAGAAAPWLASALYLNPMLRRGVSLPARGAEFGAMNFAAPVTGLFEQ